MKTFKELKLKSSQQNLRRVLSNIIANVPVGWVYREDMVANYSKNVSKELNDVGCFESPEIMNEKALVWLVIWEGEMKVANIVPITNTSIGFESYNAILDAFYNNCVQNWAIAAQVEIKMTTGEYNVEQIAGPNTFAALLAWENNCNYVTANTNPHDFDRWAEFITIAFTEKSKLSSELLRRWLIEEQGWADDDIVSKLVIDYEYGMSILDYYVKNH